MLHLQITKRRFILLLFCVAALFIAGAAQTRFTSQAGRLNSTEHTEIACTGLESSDAVQRASTVLAIMHSGNRAAVPALLSALGDTDPRVGLYVAQALGELAGNDELPALRAALQDDNADIRWRAALVLGQLRDAASVPDLEHALNDPEVLVKQYAAGALQSIGTKDAAQVLVNTLGSDRESTVHIVMGALEGMGEVAVQPLARALASNDAQVRLRAATVLGYIASPTAMPALQLATIDPQPDVREEVIWAIEQISQKG